MDEEGLAEAELLSGLRNMLRLDISAADWTLPSSTFDLAVFGEVVEHVGNPVAFLTRFREGVGVGVGTIVVTVPNALRLGGVRGLLAGSEFVNSDHRFQFTPYTISKILVDSGYMPVDLEMVDFRRPRSWKNRIVSRFPLGSEGIVVTAVRC
jgi:hypothetical protein